jgi:glycosyltransferase involved in cell wall biosynthesis
VNILVIGKYPPIEGGVSAYTFWLTRSLAGQGHSVYVITNASEGEVSLSQMHYGADSSWLGTNGGPGNLQVFQTTPLRPNSFIPFAQPYGTKLFGLSISVLEQHHCDVILSWYFEPYGFVSALVGLAKHRPTIIRHAGSDLGRLSVHPDLNAAYRWALEKATALVVTNERELQGRFGLIDRPRIQPAFAQLPDVFLSKPTSLDIVELLSASESWFSNAGLPEALLQDVRRINSKTFTGDVFTIGIYGKVGATKGSFDLIDALIKVAAAGQEFVFLTLSCGHREVLQAYYEAIVKSPALAERSWILPPIAPYRVPAFLQRCNAVCFLERHFPISFHGSQIPREILSSGACLVLSREVAEKPWYRGNLVDDRNAVIIADPTDKDSLANRLSELISDLDRTCSIGHQGRRLFEFWNEELPTFEESTRRFSHDMERVVQACY